MSAFTPKADINGPMLDVRFVPKADIGEAARYVCSGPDFRLEISGAADLN
jgi:hypothetical protein